MSLQGPALELQRLARGAVRLGEPLSPRSTLRAGGAAQLWFEPASADDLALALGFLAREGIPWSVFGGGANTLVSDAGISGCVVHLPAAFGPGISWVAEDEVEVSAAAAGIKALQAARSRGLTGPEFLVGIPGTLGGQVAMNAGTKKGEMARLVRAVELAEPSQLRWIDAVELGFRYRHSELPPGAVVTRLRLKLEHGDVEALQRELEADLEYRRRTQPWQRPNLGSTFRNPPGDAAGRLLEQSGLKGARIGQMAFSDLHANFLQNLRGGLASEAFELIETARARVFESCGVALEREVILAGKF